MNKLIAAHPMTRGTNPGTNRPVSRRRDPDRERRILAAATGAVHSDRWNEHVAARLEQGQRDYGNAWTERGAADLIAEAIEEAADLAAWALLAEQGLDAGGIEPSVADRARSLLSAAIGSAAKAHGDLEAALCLLADDRRNR